MKLKNQITLAILLIAAALFCSQITPLGKYRQIKMKNTKTSEIFTYYNLKPGEKLSFSTSGTDSVSLITKVSYNGKDSLYNYRLNYDKKDKKVEKKIKKSTSFKALDGKTLSAYNKHLIRVPSDQVSKWKFSLTNTAKQEVFLKTISYPKNKKVIPIKKITKIAYMPDSYKDDFTIKSGNSFGSYFSGDLIKPVELALEGPVTIKIISRMIYDNYLETKADYAYKVFNNGKLLAEVKKKSTKSLNSVISTQESLALSKGLEKEFKLPSGVNHLKIECSNSNRKLLYRFYIDKLSLIGNTP